MTTATLESPMAKPARWRAIVAASVGNALEWFDLVVYGFFAVIIAKLFFPAADPTASFLLTWVAFAVTYLMRPLGAIVFGVYADRFGRKSALTLSISLMMLGTLMIAVSPTYGTVGVVAPLIILIARLIQGFSAGGEFGSATAFLAEQNPAQRGFYGSWQFASQGMTTVLATGFGAGLTTILTPADLESWGWRIPFVFGLLIGPVALYIRNNLEETPEFQAAGPSDSPLKETVTVAKMRLLIGFGLVVLGTVGMYTILFMPSYAVRQLGLAPQGAFFAGLLTGIIQVFLMPFVGSASDKIGRLPLAFVASIAMFVSIYPMFSWLASTPTLQTLLIVQAIYGVFTALYMGALPALMSELFPTKIRTTGLSLTYSFGVMTFGGAAPLINEWLISVTGTKLAPSFYLMFAAAVNFIALVGARRIGFR